MKISEIIRELQIIEYRYGDMEMYLHDSADGNDYAVPTIYVDEECVEDGIHYPNECIIGFDSDTDIR